MRLETMTDITVDTGLKRRATWPQQAKIVLLTASGRASRSPRAPPCPVTSRVAGERKHGARQLKGISCNSEYGYGRSH
jgi:hypothetical protein